MAETSKTSQPGDPLINVTLDGAYRIRKALAYGFVANMYLALDLTTNREVTLKIPNEPYASEEAYLHRLEQDVNAVRAVEHPCIVKIINYRKAIESDRKLTYVVMEYVKGLDLREYFEENQSRTTLEDFFEMLDQVAEALDFIHQRKVLHKDLRLQKIIIRTFDRIPKIVDFDFGHPHDKIYRAANEFNDIDSIVYAAPETCRGLDLDSKSDLYSFAICIYSTAGKETPFDAKTPKDLYRMQIQNEPVSIREHNRAWPREFDEVIQKALSKDPQERQKNCRDFVAELEQTMRKRKDRPLVRYFSRAASYQGTPLPISSIEDDISDSAHDLAAIKAVPREKQIPRRQQAMNTPPPMPKPERIQKKRGYGPVTFAIILILFVLLMPVISALVAPKFTNTIFTQLGFDTSKGILAAIIKPGEFEEIAQNSIIKVKLNSDPSVLFTENEKDKESLTLPAVTQTLAWDFSSVEGDLTIDLRPVSNWIALTVNGERLSFDNKENPNKVNVSKLVSDSSALVEVQFIGNATGEFREATMTVRSIADGYIWKKSFHQEPSFQMTVVRNDQRLVEDVIPVLLPRIGNQSTTFQVKVNSFTKRPLEYAPLVYSAETIWFPSWLNVEHDIKIVKNNLLIDTLTINATKDILSSCSPKSEVIEIGPGLPKIRFELPEVEPRFDLNINGIASGNNYRWEEDITSRGKSIEIASAEIIGCPDIEPPLPQVTTNDGDQSWVNVYWEKSASTRIRNLKLDMTKNEVSLERDVTLNFADNTFSKPDQILQLKQRQRPCWPEFLWASNQKPFLRDISSRSQNIEIEILDMECAGVEIGESITISPKSHPDFVDENISSILSPKREGIIVALSENSNSTDRRLEILYRGAPILNLVQVRYQPPATPTPTPTPTPKPQRKPTQFDDFWLTYRSKPTLLLSELDYYGSQISGLQYQQGLTQEDELQIALSMWLIFWQSNQLSNVNPMDTFDNRISRSSPLRNTYGKVREYLDYLDSPQIPQNQSTFRMNSRPFEIYEKGKLVQQVDNTEPRINSLDHVDFSSHEISMWIELEWYEPSSNGGTKRRREHGILSIPHPNKIMHRSGSYRRNPNDILQQITELKFTSVPNAPSASNIKRVIRVDLGRYFVLTPDEILFLDIRSGNSSLKSTNSGLPVSYLFENIASIGTSQYLFIAKHKDRDESRLGIMLYDRISQAWRYQHEATITGRFDNLYPMPMTRNLILSKELILQETQEKRLELYGLPNAFASAQFGWKFGDTNKRISKLVPDTKLPSEVSRLGGPITAITSDTKDSIYYLNQNKLMHLNSLIENEEEINRGKTGVIPERNQVDQIAREVEFVSDKFQADPSGNIIIVNRFKLNLYWNPEPAYFNELDNLVNVPEY